MAKEEKEKIKKEKKVEASKEDKALTSAIDEIKERFGEGAIMKMKDIHAVNVDVIPTGSIAMDMALGVGVDLVL